MIDSDSELLRKTAAGDRAAFDDLAARYQRAVFRYARAVAGNEATAEDVTQETLLAVWRNAAAFAGEGSARAWVLTIARNAAHRQFRRHAGEPRELEPLAALGAAAGWGVVDPGFEQRAADRELVRIGFEALTAEERELLILRDVEGVPGEEVAEILGITLAAMKSRLHRARLRFMATLREKTDG